MPDLTITFSERLERINELKSAYITKWKTSGETVDESKAFSSAQQSEGEIHASSETPSEYQDRCERLVKELRSSQTTEQELQDAAWSSIINHKSTKKMGPYLKLVQHKHGRFSTVYKAIRLPSTAAAPAPAEAGILDDDWEKGNDWSAPAAPGTASTDEVALAAAGPARTVYALKVTMPAVMTAPHDSRREVRALQRLRRVPQPGPGDSHIVPVFEYFRFDGDHFVIVFPFLPLNLQDLLDAAQSRYGAGDAHAPARPSGPPTLVRSAEEAAAAAAAAASTGSSYAAALGAASQLRPLTPAQLRGCIRDVFDGLAHVHAAGVIHRDIKPSNVLLRSPDGPAFLTDFGISWIEPEGGSAAAAAPPAATGPVMTVAEETPARKILEIGTEQFRAPELLFGDRAYGTGVDLWAAGCLVAEAVMHGTALFYPGDLGSDLVLIQSIFTGLGTPTENTWPEVNSLPDWGKIGFYQYPPTPWTQLLKPRETSPGANSEYITDECRDFVSKLVTYSQASRMTAKEALEHPYLSNI